MGVVLVGYLDAVMFYGCTEKRQNRDYVWARLSCTIVAYILRLYQHWYNPSMSSRERVYRTEAVVLRRQDLGEADRLLVAYSLDRGKLRLIAKGVRRPRSRKAGHLEPFTRVQLLLARGRELDIITQAEAIEMYPGVREDLIHLGQAAYVVELLDRFTVEREANRALYRLLVHTLERLVAGVELTAVIRYYELRLLDQIGYRPELYRCLGCGAEVRPQDQFFSLAEGGVLCPDCGPGRKDAQRISLAALKVLRHYQRSTFDVATSARIRPQVFAEIEQVMEDYMCYLLERKLNTPAFLRRVRRMMHEGLKPETVV
ncbi:MAG: DNA repair protein RecO [Anaerolineales bacterium]|nr:MAG: DNA repair protein RecO [Anaerolineales bacterium]